MIDPTKMTEYKASKARLEEICLFSVLVPANNAMATAKGLDKFLKELGWGALPIGPFKAIRLWVSGQTKEMAFVTIAGRLKMAGIGKFTRKGRAVTELAFSKLDLQTCTCEDLEKIYNIGEKTSRFFVLHTRKDANVAVLDTHILHWLRDVGHENIPKSSPSGKKYQEVDQLFLHECKGRNISPAKLDLAIWNYYSGKTKELLC